MSGVSLPHGDPSSNYSVRVAAQVQDSFGASVMCTTGASGDAAVVRVELASSADLPGLLANRTQALLSQVNTGNVESMLRNIQVQATSFFCIFLQTTVVDLPGSTCRQCSGLLVPPSPFSFRAVCTCPSGPAAP